MRKFTPHLNWLRDETRVFNVGERRRIAEHSRSNGSKTGNHEYSSAAFFNPTNPDLVSIRDQLALETLNELLAWRDTRNGSRIGIPDATNSTPQRRKRVLDHIRAITGTLDGVLFLESCCYDHDILERNFRLKLDGPDYRTQDPEIALQDLRRRVAFYETSYVALGAAEEQQKIPFLQVIDVGRKINTHLIQEFHSKQVVEYMLNFNLSERQIWIFCGGESVDDSVGRTGWSSPLTNS
ncbi:6-phosphofructo-2-kinase [Sporothrix stenoceras]|uniref:6-phosphofructo-2-kinase n=1 Tax=Sporothrix stenoceras TaxID=5173 RepID=A0ABR3YS20_9PEZI